MSFDLAEAVPPPLEGLAGALRQALVEDSYPRNPHQIYDNLDSDPPIDAVSEPGRPATRRDLLESVHARCTDTLAIRTAVQGFCRSQQQQGPVMAMFPA